MISRRLLRPSRRRQDIGNHTGNRARSTALALMAICALLLLNGCSGVYVSGTIGHPPRSDVGHEKTMNIPPGHMPPPGKCRIWHPGAPPGQQPPPGDCYELRYRVPQGAVLVRG